MDQGTFQAYRTGLVLLLIIISSVPVTKPSVVSNNIIIPLPAGTQHYSFKGTLIQLIQNLILRGSDALQSSQPFDHANFHY